MHCLCLACHAADCLEPESPRQVQTSNWAQLFTACLQPTGAPSSTP